MIGSIVKLGFDSSAVMRGFARIGAGFKAMGRGMAAVGKTMLAPFVKLMAVLAPILTAGAFAKGIKDILDFGGAVSDLAARTGATAAEIVTLQEVFRRTGLEGKDVATTLQRLGKNIQEGLLRPTGLAGEAMQTLGITAETVADLSLAEQFEEVGKRIAGLTHEGLRAKIAFGLFGKEGGSLINTFKTADAFDVARKSVGGLGGNLDKLANNFDHISDALGAIGLKFRQFFAGVAAEMLPVLMSLADWINKIDLSSMGESVGKFVMLIRGAFNTGNLGELVWQSLKYAGERFIELLSAGVEQLAIKLNNAMAKTTTGAILGISPMVAGTEMTKPQEIDLGGGLKGSIRGVFQPPTFAEAAKASKGSFGSDQTAAMIAEIMKASRADENKRWLEISNWNGGYSTKVLERIEMNTRTKPVPAF